MHIFLFYMHSHDLVIIYKLFFVHFFLKVLWHRPMFVYDTILS